jgi:hypothetical protein
VRISYRAAASDLLPARTKLVSLREVLVAGIPKSSVGNRKNPAFDATKTATMLVAPRTVQAKENDLLWIRDEFLSCPAPVRSWFRCTASRQVQVDFNRINIDTGSSRQPPLSVGLTDGARYQFVDRPLGKNA